MNVWRKEGARDSDVEQKCHTDLFTDPPRISIHSLIDRIVCVCVCLCVNKTVLSTRCTVQLVLLLITVSSWAAVQIFWSISHSLLNVPSQTEMYHYFTTTVWHRKNDRVKFSLEIARHHSPVEFCIVGFSSLQHTQTHTSAISIVRNETYIREKKFKSKPKSCLFVCTCMRCVHHCVHLERVSVCNFCHLLRVQKSSID